MILRDPCPVCGNRVSSYAPPDDGFYCLNAFCSFDDENAAVFVKMLVGLHNGAIVQR